MRTFRQPHGQLARSGRLLPSQAARSVLCRATDQAPPRGFEKGLSGDVLTMFHEAQRNILELNKSRLLALDELRQAKARIQELEDMLAQYQNGAAPSRVAPPPSPAAQMKPQMGSTEPKTSAQQAQVTIAYASGWKNAFIHYKKVDGAWTRAPGVEMQKEKVGEQPGLFVVHLEQDVVEFVFNNGENDWDHPQFGENYSVKEPGEYLVQSGSIAKLS